MAEKQTSRQKLTFTERIAKALRSAACICERKSTTIRCMRCGDLTFGRKHGVCPTHPNVTFLYDRNACTKCHGPASELVELSIDYETFQKLVRPPHFI